MLFILSLQVPADVTSLLPMPPAKRWGYWGAIILHTARVFIDLTLSVTFEISMPTMVRAAITEHAHNEQIINYRLNKNSAISSR